MANNRILVTVATGLIFIGQANATSDEVTQASQELGAKMSSTISFDEGKATLTDESKREIRDLVKKAEAQGRIDEVKVAAWADREYPTANTKASKSDIDLAKRRLTEVEKFLEKDLKVDDVDTYNMTERPNALQKFLRTDTAKTKTAMESSGAAPKTTSETGLFGQKAQASKAVLMIYME